MGLSEGAITSSYVTGSVIGKSENVGGLVGNSEGAITSSYATSSVTGFDTVGGLVGFSEGVPSPPVMRRARWIVVIVGQAAWWRFLMVTSPPVIPRAQ